MSSWGWSKQLQLRWLHCPGDTGLPVGWDSFLGGSRTLGNWGEVREATLSGFWKPGAVWEVDTL